MCVWNGLIQDPTPYTLSGNRHRIPLGLEKQLLSWGRWKKNGDRQHSSPPLKENGGRFLHTWQIPPILGAELRVSTSHDWTGQRRAMRVSQGSRTVGKKRKEGLPFWPDA